MRTERYGNYYPSSFIRLGYLRKATIFLWLLCLSSATCISLRRSTDPLIERNVMLYIAITVIFEIIFSLRNNSHISGKWFATAHEGGTGDIIVFSTVTIMSIYLHLKLSATINSDDLVIHYDFRRKRFLFNLMAIIVRGFKISIQTETIIMSWFTSYLFEIPDLLNSQEYYELSLLLCIVVIFTTDYLRNENPCVQDVELVKKIVSYDIKVEPDGNKINAIKKQETDMAINNEVGQMRSMMGNIAHDLKTPLQSIRIDLESLSEYIKKFVNDNSDTVTTQQQNTDNERNRMSIDTTESERSSESSSSSGYSDCSEYKPFPCLSCGRSWPSPREADATRNMILEVGATIDSLSSTCGFMSAGISRTLDFTKSSSGLSLVPVLSSFDLNHALMEPIRCIRHLVPNLNLRVHSMCDVLEPNTELGIWTEKWPCPYMISDEHWLRENVLCYLSNAVKYGNGSDIDMYVEVVSVPRPKGKSHGGKEVAGAEVKMLQITVEDSGIGLSEESRLSLFQPFKQAQSLSLGGTGLGLYSMSKRMNSLGGECGVASRRDGGGGSAFSFSFPYRPDVTFEAMSDDKASDGNLESYLETLMGDTFLTDSSSESTPDRHDLRSLSSGSCSMEKEMSGYEDSMEMYSDISCTTEGLSQNQSAVSQQQKHKLKNPVETEKDPKQTRVLLVDDSLSILKVTSRALRQNGYYVETAMNGAIALDMLMCVYQNKSGSEVPFDAVLMDLQMPVMDGIEAIRRFREFESNLLKTSVKTDNEQIDIDTDSTSSASDNSIGMKSSDIDPNLLSPDTVSMDGVMAKESDKLKRLLIIGVSANDDIQTKQTVMNVGGDHFVSKPFMFKDVEKWLKSCGTDCIEK